MRQGPKTPLPRLIVLDAVSRWRDKGGSKGGSMKIAILGAGSLGSVIGGRLAGARHAVTLINRNPAYVEAVRRNGLILEEAGRRDAIAADAATSPEGLGPVDLLVVLVKSADTEAAIRAAAPLLGADTMVLSLQNGLGQEAVLIEAVGAARVIGGKTYVGGVMRAPGVVSAGSIGRRTIIGELDGPPTPRILSLAETFTAAGLPTRAATDLLAEIWDKLLVNVATGALGAITGLDYGNLYTIPEIEQTALAAVAEAMAVARAAGITLSTTAPGEAWHRASEGLPFGFRTSMLQSLDKGRLTEIDAVNGAVVAEGRRLGVPTPVNATLVACVKGRERALNPRTEETGA